VNNAGDAVHRFEAWIASLPEGDRRALGRAYATRAEAAGAYVLVDGTQRVAIPTILTPLTLDRRRFAEISHDARTLTAALVRLMIRLMEDPEAATLRARLFSSFSELERAVLASTWRSAAQLATVRVDFLMDTAGRHRALEVNATIPAMQAYSDVVAEAFLREVARVRRLSSAATETLVSDNGRNTDELLASLLSHHVRLGGAVHEQTIVIVAREGDAQRGELDHYAARWQTLGHDAFVATPAEVRLSTGGPDVRGVRPDLIYRHVFARRLDLASDFARMCLEPERFHVLNPVASPLEVKGMLGLLSAAATDHRAAARLGLIPEERDAIVRTLPWTRLVEAGPATGPSGETIEDLPAWVAAHGAQLVLKRSWDYGGKGVFLGAALDAPATQTRLGELVGRPGTPVSFADLTRYCANAPDAWVVQALIDVAPLPRLRVEDEGPVARELFADLSAFTNLGVEPAPSGAAVRASEGRIVNILGGGGLAPFVYEDVLQRLLGVG
jgi:hypothetical protein